ncbi:PhnD/SsuA/transferrin family substrate-binding protein [Turicimonas sp. TL08]
MLFLSLPLLARGESSIRIGLVDYFHSGLSSSFTLATVESLRKAFAPRKVEVENAPDSEILSSGLSEKFDFLIAPPSFSLSKPEIKERRIAVKTKAGKTEKHGLSVGGLAITKKDRNDIEDWKSLKGKIVATTLPTDLGAWLAVIGEIKRENGVEDPYKFFKEVKFLQHDTPNVLNTLLNDKADVGFINICRLEEAESVGLIPAGRFKPVGKLKNTESACLRSTELFPGLTLLATLKCTQEDAKIAAKAVLSMPEVEGYEWSNLSDFTSLDDLLKTLEIGPYSYLRDQGIRGLWKNYKNWFISGLVLLCLLLLNERRLQKMVEKKTKEVRDLSQEKIKLHQNLMETRERVNILEHNNVVSGLSRLVAHELKQPLTVCANHMAVLKLRLNELLNEDEQSADSIEAQENALKRISTIVDRVRNYAKNEALPHGVFKLNDIVRGAVQDFQDDHAENPASIKLEFFTEADVVCSDIEIRLMFLNLIKNAVTASTQEGKGSDVVIRIENNNIERDPKVEVHVTNAGKILDDSFLQLLNSSMPSLPSSSGGLGLGVSLIKSIAENNNAAVVYKKIDTGGIKVIITFEVASIDEVQRNDKN